MILATIRKNIVASNSYLLMILIFLIPITTAGSSVLSVLILFCWLLIADFKNDWKLVASNPIAVASLFIFGLHIVGLLWTDDMTWGLVFLKKSAKFLMLPVFMLYVKQQHIKYYIAAFISSMMLSELLSYGIWFEIIQPFKHATVSNPTPFVSHIIYNPFLALAIYILLSQFILERRPPIWISLLNIIFLLTMTCNMFITGGRSGYIGLIGMLCLLVFQRFKGQFVIALILSIVLCSSVFGVAYSAKGLFKSRVDQTFYSLKHYNEQKNTSAGKRLTWAINGFEMFLKHPLIGVGTGDFKREMADIHQHNSPEIEVPDNPHNMYILWMGQFGVLGIFAVLWLFYSQLRMALYSNNPLIKHLGVALPVLYFIVNFGESYLLLHASGLLFAVMSAFLYRNYEWKQVS